MIILLLLTFN